MKKVAIFSLILSFIFTLTFFVSGNKVNAENTGTPDFGVSLTQEKNSSKLDVVVNNPDSLSAVADTVNVELKMSYDGVTTQDIEQSSSVNQAFTMDTKVFGEFQATITFELNGKVVNTQNQTVNITADEYNIVTLPASFDATMFSLAMFGKDSVLVDHNTGENIPTVILLGRAQMWNWSNLPEGAFGLPYLTNDQLTNSSSPSDYRTNLNIMSEYVKSLYSISPNSKYHFYTNDYWFGSIFSLVYANKIASTNYDIRLLSDGSFSYSHIAKVYNGISSDANETIHKQLMNEWETAKQEAYETGKVPSGFMYYQPNKYVYASLGADPNILQWWVASPGMLKTTADDNSYGLNVVQKNDKVYAFGIADKLSAFTDVEKNKFKSLLNFENSYFGKSETSGKKIMLFIGTRVDHEYGEFPDYASLIMEQYGDSYDYYYKGHPGTPTDSSEVK